MDTYNLIAFICLHSVEILHIWKQIMPQFRVLLMDSCLRQILVRFSANKGSRLRCLLHCDDLCDNVRMILISDTISHF